VEPIRDLLTRAAVAVRLRVLFGKWRVAEVVDDWFAGCPKSETLRRIFAEAYGDDYPREADPSSFISLSDLKRIAALLDVDETKQFVDLACGRGGPGMWIARETGASVLGLDISAEAVRQAGERVADFGLQGRARFQTGSFADTGLPPAGFDGAVCIDALFLALNRTRVVREAARILRPGARLVLTNWEGGLPTMIRDHGRLLRENGFEVQVCERIRDSEKRQRAVYDGIYAHGNTLIKEMGAAAARVWLQDAKNRKYLHRVRRVLVAGTRKG
jgi:ubiquinone/menaquinone biosynthesis C-methylase UbiE